MNTLRPYPQCNQEMVAPRSRSNMKVLRPEGCIILNGKPCVACTEDIELEKETNELEKEISEPEKEKNELESRIAKIHIRRRALRTAMNENHDPLIHQFPPEIASHIFIQYSPPGECFDRPRITPLYLGAVCQKWRQLAWATPDIWTSLHIRCRRKYKRELPQLIDEWLERSAGLPLTIKLIDHSGWVYEYDEVITILNKHSARWYDMHFDISAHHLHRLSGSSEGNRLHRLVLRHPFSRSGRNDFSTFGMKSKPSPTDLTLFTVGLLFVNIAWDNLTVALVHDISADECIELIRRAPHLTTLTLQDINISSSVFPFPNTRIIHPGLRSLELLGFGNEAVVAEILDSVCLPTLEEWIHNRSPFLLDSMISFAGCSSSSLKIFKISIDRIDYHQVTRLLSHLSSIEFLELSTGRLPPSEELFSLLCASAESSLYLPHLQSLEFVSEFYFNWEYLPQIFALSRWQSLRVRVRINRRLRLDGIEDQTVKLLLGLVDEGIDLTVVDDRYIDLVQVYKQWVSQYTSN